MSKFYRTVLLMCGGVLLVMQIAAATPEYVPYVIFDDFETGEMHAWESYPYAQDIGYEPFTHCFREPSYKGSNYSLGHIKRAWDVVELQKGFTKEIDLWTTDDSRFKAAIFLTSERKPATLTLSLGCFDGARYYHVIRTPEVNRWLELDIPVSEFFMESKFRLEGQRLTSGRHIQVITIMAEYPAVNHLSNYVIYLDDFSINGARPRRFVGVEPSTTNFEMYSRTVLNRHFFHGDSFAMRVRAEDAPGAQPMTAVSMDLVDPLGRKVVSGVSLKPLSGGVWSAEKAYTFRNSDSRGQWRVELSGKDSRGYETRWGFDFIMPGKRLTPADHPRVFWTAEELKQRLAGQSDTERKMFEGSIPSAKQFANVNLDDINEHDLSLLTDEALTGNAFAKPVTSVGSGAVSWSGPMTTLSALAENGAKRYALAGDENAGRIAREALLKVCRFERWNHPWQLARGNHIYYPVGYTIMRVGTAFDLLYPLLSEEDKKVVIDGLMDKGVKMFYRDMVEMNRMPSSVTNHIAVIVSGLAVAGTAIYGEPQLGNESLEPYLSGILAKMKRFMDRTYYPDGGYGEPKGYSNMATRDIVKAMHVLERNFGVDYTSTTDLKEFWRYWLHACYSDGRGPDYGDTGVYGNFGWTGWPFQWLSYRMKNPYTAYFTQPAMEEGRGDLYHWLWYHRGLETKSREEFIPSHHFPVKGHMVMRSDWSDEGTILILKSGPNSNHYHIDQGSLLLAHNGELLLSEASLEAFKGYHAYYANPFFPFYTTQAIGHNVMLVDGDPQSQVPADYLNGIEALKNWPSIPSAFAGWKADEVESDLACVYKGKLEHYTRSFIFMKPDVIFMYDKARSPEGHTFNWLFHAEDTDGKPSVSLVDNRLTINRPRAALTMDVLSPEVTGRVRLAERAESFMQLSGPYNSKEADFLAVLVPSAKSSPSDPAKEFTSSLLNPPGWTGAHVEIGNSVVQAFFRTSGKGRATVEGYTTDADRFAVEKALNGSLKKVFLRGGSFSGGGIELTSSIPMAGSLDLTDSGAELEADFASAAEISLRLTKAPSTAAINGVTVRKLNYDASSQVLRLSVPAGHVVATVN